MTNLDVPAPSALVTSIAWNQKFATVLIFIEPSWATPVEIQIDADTCGMSAILQLVKKSVDYAGLFPPAALDLEIVVRNFAAYQNSPAVPMLGRLVIPTARLIELGDVSSQLNFATHDKSSRWKISALVPTFDTADPEQKFQTALNAIDSFNTASQTWLVDAIETKTSDAAHLQQIIPQLPNTLSAFLEIDHRIDPAPSIKAIANANCPRAFAKIRTGSIVANQIPTIEQVARFLHVCASHDVSLKATAGLHHPLRAKYRLTYEDNPPVGTMHGFANVFLAAVFAFVKRIEQTQIESILAAPDLSQFQIGADKIRWQDFEIDLEQIAEGRSKIVSFGSCSFDEPSSELLALGFSNLFD